MKTKKGELKIGYLCVVILLFIGITIGSMNAGFTIERMSTMHASQKLINNTAQCLKTPTLCTVDMLRNNSQIIYNNRASATEKGQHRFVLSLFLVGGLFDYRFYYQSEEGKEDGQLFLCRARIIDYIHLKDSGE